MNQEADGQRGGWDSEDIASWYADADWGITPDEMRIIAESWAAIREANVLDIGIGSGRTCGYLAPAALRYVGIDYSAAMIRAAAKRFPGLDLRVGDARKLDFAAGEFSFVMFSFNGIDYIDPAERNAVLAEAFRVLKPGGYFTLSSHNRKCLDGKVPEFTPPAHSRRPGNVLRRLVRKMKEAKTRRIALANFGKIRDAQWVKDDIAYVCDGGHDSKFLTCYISSSEQQRQLVAAGFSPEILVLSHDGRTADALARDPWLYYLARKPIV